MIKNCKSCDYGSINELNDIVCTNSDSANCCEFMRDDDTCQLWQNYEDYCPVSIDKINYITQQEYQELIKIYDTTKQFTDGHRDCFICEIEDCYIAIDNRSGDMWTEMFSTIGLCVSYFNGADLDELYNF